MIIDIHVHIFPQKIARSAVETLAGKCGIRPFHYGTGEEVRKLMKDAGIDYSVIQSIATNPKQTRNVNDFAISLLDIPEFIPFGSIHPEYGDWKGELERLKSAGIKGIKLHPDYQDFFVDEKRMIPIYREIFALDMALLFHAGTDIGVPPPVHCTPQRVDSVMEEFSGKPVIFAHMGGHALWDDVEKYMIGRDVFLDTSYAVHEMSTEQNIRMINGHGVHKVLFGTDSPWRLQSREMGFIRELNLPCEDEKNILGGNARRLLLDK